MDRLMLAPPSGGIASQSMPRGIADQETTKMGVLNFVKNGVGEIGSGQLVELEDMKGTPVPNFAVYVIPFFVRRAVEVVT